MGFGLPCDISLFKVSILILRGDLFMHVTLFSCLKESGVEVGFDS